MMFIQPIVDSLTRDTTNAGIPDMGTRVSIGVVMTFLLAITALLLYLKAREADKSVSGPNENRS